ncbi:hypothetical protein FHT76_006926 [Rhizobium sp. BK176]|nr:hypothetical protein [Rhizobium sp. BK181]MBB3543418.1 hypothetical protein [Rhizobium sp. BK399]MCS3743525.1 hypothetical protein [Rhizobium sp. BK661]MCS4095216.1 hypothetical protein [Rhizobium sp. BK176]
MGVARAARLFTFQPCLVEQKKKFIFSKRFGEAEADAPIASRCSDAVQ